MSFDFSQLPSSLGEASSLDISKESFASHDFSPADLTQLEQKFSSLMQADDNQTGQIVAPTAMTNGRSLLNEVVTGMNDELDSTIKHIGSFKTDLARGDMSLQEMTAKSMEVSGKISQTML